MKRNAFGETVLEPGDDVGLAFADEYGTDIDDPMIARFVDDDPNFGWCCTLADNEGNEISAQGFETREALVKWLTDRAITIEDE